MGRTAVGKGVQGNMSPTTMYAPPAKVGELVRDYLNEAFGEAGPSGGRPGPGAPHLVDSFLSAGNACVRVACVYAYRLPMHCLSALSLPPPVFVQSPPPPKLPLNLLGQQGRGR